MNTKLVPLAYTCVPAGGSVVPPTEGSIITMAVSLEVTGGVGVGVTVGAKTA